MSGPLHNAELAKVSDRERQRIAHDLHDGLGQLLGGIALKLQALHETLAEKEQPEAAHTAELVQLVNEAIAQTRMLSRGLDPVAPAGSTFASMLTKLAADTERLFRIKCVFKGAAGATPPATVQHLFRVARESINNAIRHGQATRIELDLMEDATEVTLLIRDNGSGFAQRSDPKSGVGLRIMSHRAEAIGGAIEMTPSPGGGAVVRCRAPLPLPATR